MIDTDQAHDLGQPPAGAYWLAFSSDTTPEEARAVFRAKHGQDPATIRPGLGGLLLAGPCPQRGGAWLIL
jgi:hypothetical protein